MLDANGYLAEIMRFVVLCFLSVLLGWTWGENPFKPAGITAPQFYLMESKRGVTHVKQWKRRVMLRALQSTTPYHVDETKIPKCVPVNAYICDYRK